MTSLFNSIASRLAVPLIRLTSDLDDLLVEPGDPTISVDCSRPRTVDMALFESKLDVARNQSRAFIMDWTSLFARSLGEMPQVRGFHLVRDPRDMLISASFYHERSQEPWLHSPRAFLDGESYQGVMHQRPTVRGRLLFELAHTTSLTVKEMALVPSSLPSIAKVTYESLITDTTLDVFRELFTSLGFSKGARRVAVECARHESITLNPRKRMGHVRSGQPGQWREFFDRQLGEDFVSRLGNELVALGYEADHSWVKALPTSRPSLDVHMPANAVDCAR